VDKSNRKKGEHFPSPGRLGAMIDNHLGAFFQSITMVSTGETFPLSVRRVNRAPEVPSIEQYQNFLILLLR
jgi:hypothetical protein